MSLTIAELQKNLKFIIDNKYLHQFTQNVYDRFYEPHFSINELKDRIKTICENGAIVNDDIDNVIEDESIIFVYKVLKQKKH